MSSELQQDKFSEDSESQILFEECPRDYRTEIPNIVFDLLANQKISHWALVLYSIYRRTAGEYGQCWKKIKTLASQCGFSVGKVHQARLELEKSFPELGGLPLIRVKKGNNAKHVADTVMIVDIWKYNYHKYKSKNDRVHQMNSNENQDEIPRSCHETARSCGEPKKEPIVKNNPLQGTTTYTRETSEVSESVVVFSSDQNQEGSKVLIKKDLSPPLPEKKPTKHNVYYHPIPRKPAKKIHQCLEKEDIPISDKQWISERFEEPKVELALTWLYHPTTNITTTKQQALKWVLKQPAIPGLAKAKEDLLEENRKLAKQAEDLLISTTGNHINALGHFIEIYGAHQNNYFYLPYDLPPQEFKSKLHDRLKQRNFILKHYAKGSDHGRKHT